MRISKISKKVDAGIARVECQIIWENQDRPPFNIYVEVASEFSDFIWEDPNGFLIGALLPAWKQGEKRVYVEGTVCPYFKSRVIVALLILRQWYPELGPPPVIEARDGFQSINPMSTDSACFLSCGLDSLATARSKKLLLPSDHPGSIKSTVSIDYIYSFGSRTDEEEANRTRKRFQMASQIAKDLGATQINLKTNLLDLECDGNFFAEMWYGSVLASIAHFLSRGFNKFYLAGGEHPCQLGPWGSHPLLEPYYSTAHMMIEHDGLEMTRLNKTTLVSEWPIGLQNIFVCEGENSGDSNCGTCEKCIQTMTGLLSLGMLKHCYSFPVQDVTAELLSTVQEYQMLYCEFQASCYEDFIPGLKKENRPDLVAVIETILEDFEKNGPSDL